MATTRTCDVGAAIRAGIGLEFFFTEHWSLNAEIGYLGTFGDAGDLDHSYYSAGVAYRF